VVISLEASAAFRNSRAVEVPEAAERRDSENVSQRREIKPFYVIDFGSNVPLILARIEGRCHDYAR
jgi:hypothetical protein